MIEGASELCPFQSSVKSPTSHQHLQISAWPDAGRIMKLRSVPQLLNQHFIYFSQFATGLSRDVFHCMSSPQLSCLSLLLPLFPCVEFSSACFPQSLHTQRYSFTAPRLHLQFRVLILHPPSMPERISRSLSTTILNRLTLSMLRSITIASTSLSYLRSLQMDYRVVCPHAT